MSDYGWYSRSTIEVATDGIRDEAKKWFTLSDRMLRVVALAEDQGLELSAFTVTDITGPVTAVDLKHGYDLMQHWLTDLFRQATIEFEAFGEALKNCADWYESSDATSGQNFDEIATS